MFQLASLGEADSPDTGEVALAPEGERWPGGREPCHCPKLQTMAKLSPPSRCGGSPLAEGAKEIEGRTTMANNTVRHINIIGHQNPDTDSICSALAYAWLKNPRQPDRPV